MSVNSQQTRTGRPRAHTIGVVWRVVFVLGSLALGYASFGFADWHVYQTIETGKFERAAPAKAPILAESDLSGEIQTPRLQTRVKRDAGRCYVPNVRWRRASLAGNEYCRAPGRCLNRRRRSKD